MVATINILLREPNYQSICRVECPRCGMHRVMSYGGWTAIMCFACDRILYRNRASERSAHKTGGE